MPLLKRKSASNPDLSKSIPQVAHNSLDGKKYYENRNSLQYNRAGETGGAGGAMAPPLFFLEMFFFVIMFEFLKNQCSIIKKTLILELFLANLRPNF